MSLVKPIDSNIGIAQFQTIGLGPQTITITSGPGAGR